MKTKVGLPFGLALALFIGVFTAMLALGVMTPDRADATAAAGSVKLTLSEATIGSTPQMVTIEFTNNATEITGTGVGNADITIALAGFSGDFTDATIVEDSNWKVYVNDDMLAAEEFDVAGSETSVTISLRAAVTAQPNADPPVEAADATAIPANAMVKLMFTSDDTGAVPTGFTLGTGDTDASATIDNVASEGIELTDGTGMVTDLRVTSSSMTPGARASHTFKFQISTADLIANQDTIRLYFDKDFGGLDELSASDVTVSRVSADGTTATAAFSPSSAPDRELLAIGKHGIISKDSLNNVEYTFRVPDMNGDAEGVTNIVGSSAVTVVVSSSAGITMPTEAGSKGPIGAFTNREPNLVQRKVPVNLALSLSSYASNRGKPLTIVGKGFKNGTTATVYVAPESGGAATSLGDVTVGIDDTFTHPIVVTVPPFSAGTENLVYATDGKTPPNESPKLGFEVEGLVTLSPTAAAVGDEVDITLTDWPTGEAVSSTVDASGMVTASSVTIAGEMQELSVVAPESPMAARTSGSRLAQTRRQAPIS